MSKRVLCLAVLLVVLTLPFACQKAEVRQVKTYTIEQFMDTVSIGGASFSPDEKNILFTSNKSGIYNAYTMPVEGGAWTALTQSTTDAVFAIGFFPADNRILYTSDKGGNELDHLYLRNEDGSVQDLTPDEKAKAIFLGWAHDDQSFFFGSNKRDPRFFDIYEMPIATLTPTLVYQDDTGYQFGCLSRDERFIAFQKIITDHNSDIYLYDRTTKRLKHLTPHEGDINFIPAEFGPDSRSLYGLTDEGSEFQYVCKYDLATGAKEDVERQAWDIMGMGFSHSGRYRMMGINEDARTVISLLDTTTNQPVPLPKLPDGDMTGGKIARSDTRMAFYVNGSTSPSNLYIYDFKTGRPTRLTDTLNPAIDARDLVPVQVVRYKSFDGIEIPALYYQPHQSSPKNKVPALVKVHGGPGGQARVGYNDLVQFLVNHGYAVIDVNNRGSSGYGKSFYKMDDRKHGEGDLDDCVEAKKFLASTGVVDEAKVGIIGGSYGGFMVLAALTFRPQAFALGVDIFGVSNWVRTLQSIPPYWESFKKALYEEMGDPEKDLEYVRSISPLFHADKIAKPLMVLQGKNDPRVLQVESDEIVEAAKKNGVPVEYIVFDDEGHGFVNKANEIRAAKAILDFLELHLRGVAEKK